MGWDHGGKSTTERGLGWEWQKARKQALKRDGHLCVPCLHNGRPTPATEVDHVLPRAKGGTDDLDNLESICRDCHQAKTAADEGRTYKPKVTIGADGWPV